MSSWSLTRARRWAKWTFDSREVGFEDIFGSVVVMMACRVVEIWKSVTGGDTLRGS